MLALILLAFVVLLLVFQKVGANPPLILFWLYPVVVGLYGVFLGVRMMFCTLHVAKSGFMRQLCWRHCSYRSLLAR